MKANELVKIWRHEAAYLKEQSALEQRTAGYAMTRCANDLEAVLAGEPRSHD